jgi:hypothetical protein
VGMKWNRLGRRLIVAGVAASALAAGTAVVAAQVNLPTPSGSSASGPAPGRRSVVPPTSLVATPDVRTDGQWRLSGLKLAWTVGQNDGGDTPGDWNGGQAPYPKKYEVWLNDGATKQTVHLDWCSWWMCWTHAREHWVNLGSDPAPQVRVKIRAWLGEEWSPFSNEETVNTSAAASN